MGCLSIVCPYVPTMKDPEFYIVTQSSLQLNGWSLMNMLTLKVRLLKSWSSIHLLYTQRFLAHNPSVSVHHKRCFRSSAKSAKDSMHTVMECRGHVNGLACDIPWRGDNGTHWFVIYPRISLCDTSTHKPNDPLFQSFS